MLTSAGYSRNLGPQELPDKPPYTAHLGNLSYDATVETVEEFFEGCDVANVRIIEDRDMQRPKGFGYVEFGNVDGLKKALTLDGESFQGRMIKIKIADPRMCHPSSHTTEDHDAALPFFLLASLARPRWTPTSPLSRLDHHVADV